MISDIKLSNMESDPDWIGSLKPSPDNFSGGAERQDLVEHICFTVSRVLLQKKISRLESLRKKKNLNLRLKQIEAESKLIFLV